jgi:hypothetical protein
MPQRWRQLGYIRKEDAALLPFLGDYEGDYEGAVQEQRGAAMQYIGDTAPAPAPAPAVYSPRQPAARPPRMPLPPALADQMKRVPVEVFDIFPGFPSTVYSSNLSQSTPGSESTVHTFTPPTGHYVVINPSDITQEVLYEPYDSSVTSTLIKGLISIYTRTGLQGFQQRLYHGGSEFHNPSINISSVGNRRRWQFGAVISPGDTMETRFFNATYATSSTASHLDHRVSIKKITP